MPLTLTSSGSWTDYSGTATFAATLNAGTNVIRFTGGQGGYNVARLEVTAAASAVHVEAEDYADMYGVQAEPCGEGTQNIGYIENGEWLDYTVNVPVGGTYRLVLRAASPGGGALVALQRDGATLTRVAVDATGDWQTYQSFTSGTFQLNAGTQTLRVAIPIAGVNLNWFELIPA